MKKVEIWTDGGGENPGKGGWCAILLWNNSARLLGGFDPRATNNRMEATAVYGGLFALNQSCEIKIVTDSQYVVFGLRRLQRNSMLDTNQDIWGLVKTVMNGHIITQIRRVDGHDGNHLNDIADYYASWCAKNQKKLDELFIDKSELLNRKIKVRK